MNVTMTVSSYRPPGLSCVMTPRAHASTDWIRAARECPPASRCQCVSRVCSSRFFAAFVNLDGVTRENICPKLSCLTSAQRNSHGMFIYVFIDHNECMILCRQLCISSLEMRIVEYSIPDDLMQRPCISFSQQEHCLITVCSHITLY